MFKKQYFPETTIQSLATNKTVFEKGKQLFNQEGVKDHQVREKDQMIEFTIQDNNRQFTSQISFLKNGVARKYHCTCQAFKNYSGACKHVVASMIYLNGIKLNKKPEEKTKKESSPSHLSSYHNSQVLEDLKESFSRHQVDRMSNVGKEEVNFEFILNVSGSFFSKHFELYLKVGIDHLYVIKNIPQVVNTLLKGETYEFGKNFTFDPNHYYVAPEDKRVLQLLADIHSIYKQTAPGVTDTSHANKTEFEIPNQFVADLLNNLKDTDGGFVRFARPPRLLSSIDQLEAVDFSSDLEDFPIYFELLKQGTRYYFKIKGINFNSERIFFIDEAHLVQINHSFYAMSEVEYHIFKSLVETFKEAQYQPISFRNSELTDFMTYIYPSLNQYFKINLDNDISRLLFEEPLVPELYLDYQDGVLEIEPIFKYGDLTIQPLKDDQAISLSERIMVRDRIQENQLMDSLFEYLPDRKLEDGKWLVKGTQKVSQVIYDSIPRLHNQFDFYLTEAVKKLRYQASNNQPVHISVNEESNLLEIDFDLEEISDDEISDIIKALRQSDDRFYKLSSGSIIDLQQKDFQELNDIADNLSLESSNFDQTVHVPLYQGLSLLENDNVQKSDQFIELAKSLLEPKEIEVQVPDEIQADLRPYQEVGFNWLKTLDAYQFGGILADDMGLGKTLQSITFIQSKMNTDQGKYLVVCPSSVLYNWENEFKKFTEDIEPTVISGTIKEREDLIKELAEAENGVWITSYPLLQRDGELYRDIHFETVILDESQNVKNDTAKTTKAVSRINAKNKFALSGTPIENNLEELWTIFSIIQPGMFKDKSSFKQMDNQVIASKIKPFILRRLKGQVLDDLPEKTETTEYIELNPEQKRIYQTQLAMIQKEVEGYIEDESFEQNSMKILTGLTRLRQICCDPKLVTNQYEGQSAKLERLMEYLKEAKVNGKRVVLFSQFTKMLDIIREELGKIGYDYHYLDGQTKKEDRLELTERFNNGEKDLFLISLKAGGTGLNLTGGDTVILYDSWWNPAIEDQAADRVHRIGQKKSVQVLRLIARGTIEERINELQDKKRALVDSVVDSNNSTSITRLTKEEILKLLDVN